MADACRGKAFPAMLDACRNVVSDPRFRAAKTFLERDIREFERVGEVLKKARAGAAERVGRELSAST